VRRYVFFLIMLGAIGFSFSFAYDSFRQPKIAHSQGVATCGLDTVTVRLPGGLAKEAGGGLLMSLTPYLLKMVNNKNYVLFLKPADGQASALTTVRGSQGIFELPADGSGVIHLGSAFEPQPGPPRQEQSVFLEAVRRFRSN